MYFALMRELNPPNKSFTLEKRLFNATGGKHVPKDAESHRCEVNTRGTFACNFSTEGFSKGFIFENRLQNLNGGKFLEIIEHVK